MADQTFRTMLEKKWDEGKFLCVGLDPDFDKIPDCVKNQGVREGILAFNKAIIDATRDLVCAYKPNAAFYEAHGEVGWGILRDTIQYIHEVAPEVAVVLDAKRGDIGNTNEGYIKAIFGNLGANAVTVNPYMGQEALQPFLELEDVGVIVLCKTSNGGAAELQNLKVDGTPIFQIVAKAVAESWNTKGNCALVVGATYPQEMREVRAIAPDLPFLIPGIGAQGGDLAAAVAAGKDARGKGMIIAASRSIIFASAGEDFAQAARSSALDLHTKIQAAL